MAISDFIASFLYRYDPVEMKPEKVRKDYPDGYRPLFFHCWLCKGTTRFAMKNSIKKKKFTMECSRCGVENSITVNTPN
jgi:hypothetical protein